MGGLRRLKIKMIIFFGPIGILDPHMPAQFSQNWTGEIRTAEMDDLRHAATFQQEIHARQREGA